MSPVRVIRVLEYEYPTHEAAEQDMVKWGVPANGVRSGFAGGRSAQFSWSKIRSATTFPATAEDSILAKPAPPEVIELVRVALGLPEEDLDERDPTALHAWLEENS